MRNQPEVTRSELAGERTSGARPTLFRQIPSVDELLNRPHLAALARQVDRALIVEVTRAVLDDLRAAIARQGEAPAGALELDQLESRVAAEIERTLALSLRAVINATGVILHTNLGRAPLARDDIEHLRETATQY
jgi:L-seryl-tRNA(Ser) seleniumtransferase